MDRTAFFQAKRMEKVRFLRFCHRSSTAASSRIFRGSPAGRSRVVRKPILHLKYTIIKIFLPHPLPKSLTSETNQAPCAKLFVFYMRKLVYINYF